MVQGLGFRRLVPPPVLIGHAASLSQVALEQSRDPLRDEKLAQSRRPHLGALKLFAGERWQFINYLFDDDFSQYDPPPPYCCPYPCPYCTLTPSLPSRRTPTSGALTTATRGCCAPAPRAERPRGGPVSRRR